ncbi:HAD domain-containing protein [Streptomyces sp. YIM S03343]
MTLLFLDIDGTLIPFGAPSYPDHKPPPTHPSAPTHPLLPRLDPALGPRLTALGCDLVWATTWMEEANATVSPWLGLPPLPVLDCPDEQDQSPAPRGLHWKTPLLVTWAAARPFIWLDDEITATDRTWVETHHPSPSLLHRVNPREGLTDADFAALERWLAGLL